MANLTAFILVGGRSSRMGADKALLKLGGQTLIDRAIAVAGSVGTDVKVVGDPSKYAAFGRVVPDVYVGRGPLGGIHAALGASATDLNLILGVDLPFVPASFLKLLLSQAQSSEATVTVPSAGGYLHPLCGVYRKTFCDSAERALLTGNNKIDAIFVEMHTRIITEDEILDAGFSPSMFRNLNTPEDWEQARKEVDSEHR
jgi:molybdopterin-guanine dinucleotide biosynthesis protein A